MSRSLCVIFLRRFHVVNVGSQIPDLVQSGIVCLWVDRKILESVLVLIQIGKDLRINGYWVILNWVLWVEDFGRHISQGDGDGVILVHRSMTGSARESLSFLFHVVILVHMGKQRPDLQKSGYIFHHFDGIKFAYARLNGFIWVNLDGFGSQISNLQKLGTITHQIGGRNIESGWSKVLIGMDLGFVWFRFTITWFLRDNYYGSQSNLQKMESRIPRFLIRFQRSRKLAEIERVSFLALVFEVEAARFSDQTLLRQEHSVEENKEPESVLEAPIDQLALPFGLGEGEPILATSVATTADMAMDLSERENWLSLV